MAEGRIEYAETWSPSWKKVLTPNPNREVLGTGAEKGIGVDRVFVINWRTVHLRLKDLQ